MNIAIFVTGYFITAYGVSLGIWMLRHWSYAHNYSWIDAK